MTTNFTFRDFFVYLLVGLTFIICMGIIFIQDIFSFTVNFFDSYKFVKEFSFIITIFLIPVIYLAGHVIGSASYYTLRLYVRVHRTFKKSGKIIPKWKCFVLIKLQQLLYRHRVVYAIVNDIKSNSTERQFTSVSDFWKACAKLQIEKVYAPAEYWMVLNELFNSINLIFFISTLISLLTGQWILSIVYFLLAIFAFKRARQYADHFVQTVRNLTLAKQSNKPEKS